MRLRVIDLDGVGEQAAIAARYPVVVPACDLAPKLRLWASRKAFAELGERLAATNLPGEGPSITFIGSGDFHNLTPLLLREAGEPVVVVHIDNHPDWVKAAPRHHCGAWVNRALEMPAVLKVITVGPTSADLDSPDTRGGAFDHLASGRIEMLPWARPASRVRRTLADGAGHRVHNGQLVWREIGEDFDAFLPDLIARLPKGVAVWLTIDKDGLRPQDAATNWDQGLMPLEALERLIETVATARRIVGVDICGDWSEPRYDTPMKSIEAFLDRPKGQRGAAKPDLAINERTNARLLNLFERLFDQPGIATPHTVSEVAA